jgi:sugar/nucleoside kinase (ribokinase family)
MRESNQQLRPQVVCIGSAALDMVLEVDAAPASDERVPASAGILAGGGPAATTAVTLSRLGVSVTFVGRVGADPAGTFIREGLEREGVGVELLSTDPGLSSSLSSCLVEADGSRALAAFGFDGSPALAITPAIEAACRAATWIHVDHAGWPAAVQLRHRGVRTNLSVDGGNPIPELDLALVTLYAPSRREICRWTDQPDLGQAMRSALEAGTSIVVATDGGNGSAALSSLPPAATHLSAALAAGLPPTRGDKPHAIQQAAYPAAGRSTLGAGDVYHGALLAALLDGRPLAGAMAFASAAAAISCRAADGRSGIPSWAEVEQLLATTGSESAASPASPGG